MKKIIGIGLMLMALAIMSGSVLATREKDETSRSFPVYRHVSSYAANEVGVCRSVNNPNNAYYTISIRSANDYGKALAIGDALLGSFPSGNFDHFGCVWARV